MTASKQNETGAQTKLSRHWGELIIETLIWLAGVSTIAIVGLIFLFLLKEGLPTFLDIPLRQLFGSRWYPIEGLYGILPLLIGSLMVTIGAVVIAVPLGLIVAIYLGEFFQKPLTVFLPRIVFDEPFIL